MQLIYSLLFKDFYLNTDLISSFKTLPDEIYKFQENIILLQNINNQKLLLKNILFILDDSFYSQLNETIKFNEKTFFNINLDVSNIFKLLYQSTDYTQNIVSKINNFYKEFNFEYLDVSKENYISELEKEIDISNSTNLIEQIKTKLDIVIKEQNYKIFEEIVIQYKNTISNIDCRTNNDLDNLFEYFQYRLFIFFKVVGKDFISFINKPITDKDTITTILFKYNKNFLLQIRFELINFWYYKENNIFTNLTTQEIFFMIFLLTYRDKNLTLLDNFCIEYNQNEKKYSDKSIRIHRLYHYK